MQLADPYIGQRLSVDGQLCTVRYVGPITNTKGEWLGVEWDDDTRGKNSGKHLGTRYFSCRPARAKYQGLSNSATAGSFIRPTRKFDPPRSLVEALKNKYASEETLDSTSEKSNAALSRNSVIKISGKEAEEVGFDKIRRQLANFKALKYVILDGLCIAKPFARRTREEISESIRADYDSNKEIVKLTCPNITTLDLSRNLFEEWKEITQICLQLERLTTLKSNGNRFRKLTLTETEEKEAATAFAKIDTLELENTLLPWDTIADLTHQFADLTKLVASNNQYTSLATHIPINTVTEVVLEDNEFTSLSDLQPLASLPSLKRLILNRNNISQVGKSAPFSTTLYHVELAWNKISTWPFFSDLPKVFPGLKSLRASHNALLEPPPTEGQAPTKDMGYTQIIARLPALDKLDYSEIKTKDMMEAELYYLNTIIAKELISFPENEQESLLVKHPRYRELCEEYGEPAIKRKIEGEVDPDSLGASLIKFSLYVAGSQDHKNAEMEIPMSITTYTLIGLVARNLGLDPMKCKLIYETGDWIPKPKSDGAEEDFWSSEDSEGEDAGSQSTKPEKAKEDMIMREVEIVPGTRSVGSWIDGMEAVVRVEVS